MLRPYQAESVAAVLRDWTEVRSTLLVLATGCGKTHTASAIIRERLDCGRVLWLAHREELLTQARDALALACPGVPIGIEQGDSWARVTGFHDLADRIVVASVQTLHEKRRSRFDPTAYATVVVDEAHHAAARTYREILDYFTDAKVLGLTATPDRGDGLAMGEIFERVAYEYPLRRAIDDGYLCPVRAVQVDVEGLDLSSVWTTAGDLNQGQLARLLEVDEVHHQIASPLVKLAGDRPTIVFATSVEQSKALCDVLAGYTTREVRHLDGTTPSATRARILREFASGAVQFVSNVGVLTEGFDAPRTSCIALARPTKSRALYAQMVGRGTRLAPDKSDCLIVDFRGNAGRHSLANPVDLLAGKPISDEARKLLDRSAKDGKILDVDAIEAAEAEIVRRQQEADRRRAAAAKLSVQAKHSAKNVELFGPFDPGNAKTRERASHAQRDRLINFGVDERRVNDLTRDQAQRMLDKLFERSRAGLCSYKQARLLARHGLRHNLTKQEASIAIGAIQEAKWHVPAQIQQRFGA